MIEECQSRIYIPSQNIGKYSIQSEIQGQKCTMLKVPFSIEIQTTQSLITLDTYKAIESSIVHKSKYLGDIKVECIKIANLYLINCQFKMIDSGYNVIGKDILDYFAYQIAPKNGLYLYPDPNSKNLLINDSSIFLLIAKHSHQKCSCL